MPQPLLSGEQEYVREEADPRILSLEAEVRDLRRKLAHAEMESQHAKADVGRSLAEMQRLTMPFYKLLRAIHGEIDAIGITESGSVSAPQFDPRWNAWKQKLGSGAPSKVIDALLAHGPLNRTQLRSAAEMGWSTLDAATARLKNLSLIEKVGDRWQLKQLA